MACGARSGLKPHYPLQWHFFSGRSKEASPEAQPGKQLGEMSLQSLSSLLQHGNGQLLGGSKTQGGDVVTDVPMRPPGPFLDAPLMMSREVARFSHKPKRVLLCHPGKPLWGVRLKREHAVLRTDHHIVPLLAILDARDDMNRLAGRFGSGTRAGSLWRRLGWTDGGSGRLCGSRRGG